MRNTILATIFICHAATAFSQQCVISSRKENVVYIGVPNPIDIAVEGRYCKDFSVSTDNGTLEHGSATCNYELSPAKAGMTEISVKDKKSGKVISKAMFRTKPLPPPTCRLAGKDGGEISKSVLKVQVALSVMLEGFDFDARFSVEGYRVTIFRGNKVIFTEGETGARFPSSVTEAFKMTEQGDSLVFSNLKAKAPDQQLRSLPPIEFEITN